MRALPTQLTRGAPVHRFSRCAFALAAAIVWWEPSTRAEITPPGVPAELQVPPGHAAALVGHASGTQDYICLPATSSPSGFVWTFFGPQATVLDDHAEQIATHFLSPNPVEDDTPRATWQHSGDTSAVWAKMIASSSDPSVVAAGAIPWFLLQVVGSQSGPTNGDRLTAVSYVQRVNTAGGVAPATGCAQAADVGTKSLVPYTADYVFFSPSVGTCAGDCNGDGHTTVNELLTMVAVAVHSDDPLVCPAGDGDASGTITVDEIVRAVAAALGNPCAGGK
jgi:hypothetical protein